MSNSLGMIGPLSRRSSRWDVEQGDAKRWLYVEPMNKKNWMHKAYTQGTIISRIWKPQKIDKNLVQYISARVMSWKR